MNLPLLGLAAAGVFVLLLVLGAARVGKGPARSMRRRPDRQEIGVVVVALVFSVGLAGLAYSPYGSAVSIIGVAIVANAIVLVLSVRRRSDAEGRMPDDP